MNNFLYLYGFVPHDTRPPEHLIGIGGSGVETTAIGAMQAVISRVPADTYNPVQIETRLQDLQWVAEQGVAHERVVAWFVDNAQILPVPLFTMYSGAAALQDAVAVRATHVASELARLRNQREWDIKISWNAQEAEEHAAALSPAIAELEREAAQATPGKRYLIEKKRADLLKTETRRAAQEKAGDVLTAIAQIVTESKSLPIPRVTEELPVILHAALLVDRGREAELVKVLEQEAARLNSLGLSLSFSGPWAPYRFTGEND